MKRPRSRTGLGLCHCGTTCSGAEDLLVLQVFETATFGHSATSPRVFLTTYAHGVKLRRRSGDDVARSRERTETVRSGQPGGLLDRPIQPLSHLSTRGCTLDGLRLTRAPHVSSGNPRRRIIASLEGARGTEAGGTAGVEPAARGLRTLNLGPRTAVQSRDALLSKARRVADHPHEADAHCQPLNLG